jgi:glutamate-1-semialdehyde aminotransferase
VAEAICRQASTLLHVSNFFTNPRATAAAVQVNELLRDATGHAGQIFFTNSGAESNEAAIKLARKFGGRGRHTVVSALGSFHGGPSPPSPRPVSRQSTSRSRRCPKGSGTWHGATSTRCARPSTVRSLRS